MAGLLSYLAIYDDGTRARVWAVNFGNAYHQASSRAPKKMGIVSLALEIQTAFLKGQTIYEAVTK